MSGVATLGTECVCGDINGPGERVCDGCGRPIGNSCIGCGAPLPVGVAGRPRKYCGNACRRDREAPWSTWTSSAIIVAVQAWAEKHGGPPTADDWRRAGRDHPNESCARRRFGSWNAVIEAAGFDPRDAHRPALKWTRAETKVAFFKWMYEHGRLPKFAEWETWTDEHPSGRQVIRMFGSWNAGIIAAGYEPTRRYRTDEEYREQAA